MAQSLSKLYIHLVFHIKTSSQPIRETDLERVHSYIGQLVNTTGCKVIQVGGICDHVHILFLLSKDATISHVVEEVKRNSSRWVKTIDAYYHTFAWQNGYAAFSVSQSVVGKALEYVKIKVSIMPKYPSKKSIESSWNCTKLNTMMNLCLKINAFALSGRKWFY